MRHEEARIVLSNLPERLKYIKRSKNWQPLKDVVRNCIDEHPNDPANIEIVEDGHELSALCLFKETSYVQEAFEKLQGKSWEGKFLFAWLLAHNRERDTSYILAGPSDPISGQPIPVPGRRAPQNYLRSTSRYPAWYHPKGSPAHPLQSMYQQPTSMNGRLFSPQYGASEPQALAFDPASQGASGKCSKPTFAPLMRPSSQSSSSTTTSSGFSQPTASSTGSSPTIIHNKPGRAKPLASGCYELSPASARFPPTLRPYVFGYQNASTTPQTVVTARFIEDNTVILEKSNNPINQSALWSCLMENMSIDEGDFEVQHAKSSNGRIQLVLRFATTTLAKKAIQSLSYTTTGSEIRVIAGCTPRNGEGSEISEKGKKTKGGPVICDGSIID